MRRCFSPCDNMVLERNGRRDGEPVWLWEFSWALLLVFETRIPSDHNTSFPGKKTKPKLERESSKVILVLSRSKCWRCQMWVVAEQAPSPCWSQAPPTPLPPPPTSRTACWRTGWWLAWTARSWSGLPSGSSSSRPRRRRRTRRRRRGWGPCRRCVSSSFLLMSSCSTSRRGWSWR